MLGEQERAGEQQRDDRVPAVLGEVLDRRDVLDADFARRREPAERRRAGAGPRRRCRSRAREVDDGPCSARRVGGGRARRSGRSAGDRDRAADAAGGAGDEGGGHAGTTLARAPLAAQAAGPSGADLGHPVHRVRERPGREHVVRLAALRGAARRARRAASAPRCLAIAWRVIGSSPASRDAVRSGRSDSERSDLPARRVGKRGEERLGLRRAQRARRRESAIRRGPQVRVGAEAVLGDEEAGAGGAVLERSTRRASRPSGTRSARSWLDLLDRRPSARRRPRRCVHLAALLGLELDLVGEPALELGRLGDQLPGALAGSTGRTISRLTKGIGGSCNQGLHKVYSYLTCNPTVA